MVRRTPPDKKSRSPRSTPASDAMPRSDSPPSEKNQPDFDKGGGLIPVVVQATRSGAGGGDVLMLAYMNREAYEETLATGQAVYFSRSRGGLWRKGETSGHVQIVKRIRIDCDRDTLLLEVEQVGGAACHEGYKSCFFREIVNDQLHVVEPRRFDPQEVYKNPDP